MSEDGCNGYFLREESGVSVRRPQADTIWLPPDEIFTEEIFSQLQ